MSANPISTLPSRRRSRFQPPPVAPWPSSATRIGADALRVVREPLRWLLHLEQSQSREAAIAALAHAARGPARDDWEPPAWLLPHQTDAARRIAGSLDAFRGAILADATGLGKTYIALAVATRYRAPVVLAPAAIVSQWHRTAARVGVRITAQSLERASRDARIPHGDLVVVDEAHHLRNPATRRYDAVSRRVSRTPVLLLTATPVATGPRDLLALLRLFLPDNALALLGVPSLEVAIATRRYGDVARAASAVLVARTAESLHQFALALPRPEDVRISETATTSSAATERLLARIDQLRFPGALDDGAVASLLRAHLVHRLCSSTAALRETVERHATYVRRAIESVETGRPLARSAARALLGAEDDAQLLLDLVGPAEAGDIGAFTAERDRLADLRLLLHALPEQSEKSGALARMLAARIGRKTIVFTAARATALSLARSLAWRRVGVACGGGAIIATGRVPLDQVLSWFAPTARGAAPPDSARVIDTLIATDLVSEGLDLQDADTIVHYDLPWTPLRLAQRLGRIARLGGVHDRVNVWWFLPPRELDARLRLTSRIVARSFAQRRLGTDAPRRPGFTAHTSGTLHWREWLAAQAAVSGTAPDHGWCAVAHPGAAFALEWRRGPHTVPELMVLSGKDSQPLTDPASTWCALCKAASVPAAPVAAWMDVLRELVRRRMAAASQPSADRASGALARAILRHGRRAAAARDRALLERLDMVLTRVQGGLCAGAARQLGDLLRAPLTTAGLDRWLAALPIATAPWLDVRVSGALLGQIATTPPRAAGGSTVPRCPPRPGS